MLLCCNLERGVVRGAGGHKNSSPITSKFCHRSDLSRHIFNSESKAVIPSPTYPAHSHVAEHVSTTINTQAGSVQTSLRVSRVILKIFTIQPGPAQHSTQSVRCSPPPPPPPPPSPSPIDCPPPSCSAPINNSARGANVPA